MECPRLARISGVAPAAASKPGPRSRRWSAEGTGRRWFSVAWGFVMGSEELKGAVLALADADPTLSEDAKLLILGALDGDEMFAEVIRGESGPIERPAAAEST